MEFNKVGIKSLHYKLVLSTVRATLLSLVFIMPSLLLFFIPQNGTVLGITTILVEIILFFLTGTIISSMSYKMLGYKIEENSLKLQKGLFSINTKTVPFNKITNVTYNQTFLQRLFDVGNISIDQEDSYIWWSDIDKETAKEIIDTISAKTHVQFFKEK